MTDISNEKIERLANGDCTVQGEYAATLRAQAARIAELEAALAQCRGMADEGTTAPNAAYRWCERIEEVAIAARPLPEYAEWSHTKGPMP